MTMIFKTYLFLTVQHPCLLCTRASSSRGEWGLLSRVAVWGFYYSGFSCRGARGLGHVGSTVAAPKVQAGSVAAHGLQMFQGMWDLPSLTKDQTGVRYLQADSLPLDQEARLWFCRKQNVIFLWESHQECLVYSWFSINVC